MISVLVRSSNCTWPRDDSTDSVISPRQVGRPRVVQGSREHDQLARQRLFLGESPAGFRFGSEDFRRRNPDDGPIEDVLEPVRLENQGKRLVPRHVAQRDVHAAVDLRVDDDVQAADLGECPQHRAQVGVLKIERHGMPGVLRRRLSHLGLPERLRPDNVAQRRRRLAGQRHHGRRGERRRRRNRRWSQNTLGLRHRRSRLGGCHGGHEPVRFSGLRGFHRLGGFHGFPWLP